MILTYFQAAILDNNGNNSNINDDAPLDYLTALWAKNAFPQYYNKHDSKIIWIYSPDLHLSVWYFILTKYSTGQLNGWVGFIVRFILYTLKRAEPIKAQLCLEKYLNPNSQPLPLLF